MVTLKDVARRANVSVSTVSHVINGYQTVKKSTREAVLKAIEDLDYHPNAIARSLLSQKSNLIGLVTIGKDALLHPFLHRVVTGMVEGIQDTRFGLTLSMIDPQSSDPSASVSSFRERRLEGMVVMGIRDDSTYVTQLALSGIPAVFIDIAAESETSTYVTSDNFGGAKSATTHLCNLGHERIAYIDGVAGGRLCKERYAGYKAALAEAGIGLRSDYVVEGGFTKLGGASAIERLMSLASPPSAVFVASDLMAFGVLAWLEQHGFSVPEDVAVVGFDGIETSEHVSPPLTTVYQFAESMGQSAVEMLMEMVDGKRGLPPRVIPTELVVRQSCGAHLRRSAYASLSAEGKVMC